MNLLLRTLRSTAGRRRPPYDGTLSLRGLRRPVNIWRDAHAIPTIEAETDEDAWFGLGFCQGQDRAFQLELRLRTARGTLASLLGEAALPIDRLSRRIGFVQSAARQRDVLDADVRAQIEAFVRGVNAGFEAGGATSPEFALLRSRPTPWAGTDVLAVGKLVSFLMIGNWDVELARLKILTTDGADALRDLDPVYPADHLVSTPVASIAGPAIDRLSEDLSRFVGFAGTMGGSNNWAVAGARTRNGRPIVANDPHLDPVLPPHWYLAHLKTPAWQVAGAALAGTPAIGIGHNGFGAWGITAALTDTVDLFIEDVAPDGRSVRRGAGYEACDVRREIIEVRGRSTVVEDVLVTQRGPVIGPALDGGFGAISLRAVWLDAKPVRGFLTAHRTRSLEAFRREFEAWPLLPSNVVYADETGSIVWQVAGEVPRRRSGWGTLPLPASDPETGWEDEGVSFDAMPYAIDPPEGFVASANNKPASDAAMPYLGADWLDGYRFGRIVEALASRDDWDVASTLRLQLDETSLAWREVRAAVLALPPTTEDARIALELLGAWDGVVTADSSAAAVWELFVQEMWRRLTAARAPKSADVALGRGFTPLLGVTTFAAGRVSTLLRRIVEQPAGWFARPWPEEMSDALAASVETLRSRFGADASAWRWGYVRRLTLEHPLSVVKQLAPLLNRGPYVFGGDANTVSQAGGVPGRPLASPGNIASMRMVVEVGDWDETRFALPGGQSGDPLSPHYDDLIPIWLRGEGVAIPWSDAAVARTTRHTQRLLPLAPR